MMSTSIFFKNRPPVILASTSPRRMALLNSVGINFEVVPPAVDEGAFDLSALPPEKQVLFLAKEKAQSVANAHLNAIVIGVDTLVAVDGTVLGKPKDSTDAFTMLAQLQNNVHQVYTAIAVIYQNHLESDYAQTQVWMRALTAEEINAYIETGEPMDKAGAYAIQGLGSLNITQIEGCYFNVVGMSLQLLEQLFRRHGFSLLSPVKTATL